MITVIDTWSYADGIVVDVAQMAVSLPTASPVVPMAEHVDGHWATRSHRLTDLR
jgi:hypothetical protein